MGVESGREWWMEMDGVGWFEVMLGWERIVNGMGGVWWTKVI